MDIEKKDNRPTMTDEEEPVLLPEGYGGEMLFPETGEKAEEETASPGETEKTEDRTEEKVFETAPQEGDFQSENAELPAQQSQLYDKLAYGETLPREVIAECEKTGVSLRTAYAEYEARQARAEAERMRRENEILKQNSAAAARAPVKGTAAGGGTEIKGKDPFLEGLLSDE